MGIVLLRGKRAKDARGALDTAAQAKPNEFRPRRYLAEALRSADEPAPRRKPITRRRRRSMASRPAAATWAWAGAGAAERKEGKEKRLSEAAETLREGPRRN